MASINHGGAPRLFEPAQRPEMTPGAGVGNARDPYVHHGALAVAREIDPQFRAAERYLRGDSIMRQTLDRIEHAKTTTHLIGNTSNDSDSFDERAQVVEWDPYRAFRTTEGGRVSPALALGHELAHAAADPATRARLSAINVEQYDNAEERRVIRGAERHAAQTLGEAMRSDHRATGYDVASPTAR